MRTEDFYYDLPEELIAQIPADPRDSARMLVCHREDYSVEHKVFRDVIDYLKSGDVLVINNTRVMPARLFGVKKSGARLEFLLLKRLEGDNWECLVKPAKRARMGDTFSFSDELSCEITGCTDFGGRTARFIYDGVFEEKLDKVGLMPLPPYIHRTLPREERENYQTVYAKFEGSSAAPTAGLHFTPELLERIKAKGVEVVEILLHVGLGTFRPVQVEEVEKHVMHSEHYEVSVEAAEKLNRAKSEGRRIIACGTTSVRTLESATGDDGRVRAERGNTSIFLYPPYKFKTVDALITNFHLPESTLIMLVSAFMGSREKTLELYETAVKEKYRFFSFGDACFFL